MAYEKGLVVEWEYHAGKVHGVRQGAIVLYIPEFESIAALAAAAGVTPNKDVSYKDSSSIDRYLVQASDGKFYAPKATIVSPTGEIKDNAPSESEDTASASSLGADDEAVSDEFGSIFDYKYVLFAKSDTAKAYGREYSGGIKVIVKGGDFAFLRESGAHEDARVLTIQGLSVSGVFGVRTINLSNARERAVAAVVKAFEGVGFETDAGTVASLIYSGDDSSDFADEDSFELSVRYR